MRYQFFICLGYVLLNWIVYSFFIPLSGTIKVISAKLSKCGSPLVVLATRHAFLFDMSLMCWLRVADDCFPASNFASSWNLGSTQSGELAGLQVDVRKYLARKPGWSRYYPSFQQFSFILWSLKWSLEFTTVKLLTWNYTQKPLYHSCRLLLSTKFISKEKKEEWVGVICLLVHTHGGLLLVCMCMHCFCWQTWLLEILMLHYYSLITAQNFAINVAQYL